MGSPPIPPAATSSIPGGVLSEEMGMAGNMAMEGLHNASETTASTRDATNKSIGQSQEQASDTGKPAEHSESGSHTRRATGGASL